MPSASLVTLASREGEGLQLGRYILVAVVMIAVVGTFAGALHPLGDSLAVFRLPIAVLAGLVLLAIRRPWWVLLPGLGLCGFAVLSILLLKMASHTPGPVVIYQKNMRYSNRDTGPLLADILQRAPDHITLEEVTIRHRSSVEAGLKQAYPTQQWCRFRAVGGTMVLSRWPMVPGTAFCTETGGLSGVQVVMPEGPVWVLAMHLYWPWPYEQEAQREQLAGVIAALDGPVILGGDFNMVAWSYTMTRMMSAARVKRTGPVAATFAVNGVPLPIDHVLAPGGGQAQIIPKLGSDHYGVLARVNIWP